MYISEYIPHGACNVCRVMRCGNLNERFVILCIFYAPAWTRAKKGFISPIFSRLLRVLEVDIVEYKRQFICQPLLYVFISCMVVCMGPYSCLLYKMCRAYPDFGFCLHISVVLKILF